MIKVFQKNATSVVLLIATVIYYLFISYVPFCYDDWNFREMYMRVSDGGFVFSGDNFADYVTLVRYENDGRLSNIVDILVQFAPRWIYDIIFACCVALWLKLSSKLTVTHKNLAAMTVSVIWAMYVIFLPWRDGIMSCVDFSLNYVVASALSLVFVWLWRLDNRSVGIIVVSGVTALIVGCWHEGFSVSLAGGLAVYCFFHRRSLFLSHRIIMCLMLAVGIVIALTSEGLRRRMEGDSLIVVNMSYVLRDMMPVLLSVALLALMMCKNSWRQLLRQLGRDTLFLFWLGGMLSGTIIALHSGHTPRVAWCADMFAVLVLGSVIGSLKLQDRVANCITVITTGALIAFYCGVIGWQMRTQRDYESVMTKFEQSIDGVIEYDYSAYTPIYTLHHPSRFQLVDTVCAPYLRGIDEHGRTLRYANN